MLAALVLSTSATIHYQTPMLGLIGSEFHSDAQATGWIATLSFAGYLTGTLFLVPLGDRFDKRSLILGQVAVLVIALLGMAAAPSLLALAGVSFVAGICTSVSQHVVALVAERARPDERGRQVGAVMSGMFIGILLGRVAGGQIADHVGWRWTYVVGAALVLVAGIATALVLPKTPTKSRLGYGALLRSMAQLFLRNPAVRYPSAVQFFLGICYGGFWATLASMLMLLHGFGPSIAGLIGIPGAAGILVARPAGRWLDRSGGGPVGTIGIVAVIAAFATFALAQYSIFAVIAGAILLDCGLRATMVANQTLVTTAVPEARSRATTIFAAHMWGGNALGALVMSIALARWGWFAVCGLSAVSALAALSIQRLTVRRG